MMAHVFGDDAARAEMEDLVPLGRGGNAGDIAAMAICWRGRLTLDHRGSIRVKAG